MSEKANQERDNPIDLYVLQPPWKVDASDPNAVVDPNNPSSFIDSSDANYSATLKTWGDGEKWKVIKDLIEFVNYVKTTCGDKKYIRVLRIGGHGSLSSFRLGEIQVTPSNIDVYEVWLKEIVPYLILGKSLICLDHCKVGGGDILLQKLSKIWIGVPILAPFDDQYDNEGAPQFEGNGRICNSEFCVTTYSPNDKSSELLSFFSYFGYLSKLPTPNIK